MGYKIFPLDFSISFSTIFVVSHKFFSFSLNKLLLRCVQWQYPGTGEDTETFMVLNNILPIISSLIISTLCDDHLQSNECEHYFHTK